jgi:hypothetical protein
MVDEQTLSGVGGLTRRQPRADWQQGRLDHAHEAFGFELFRRAIVENNEQGWSALYHHYEKLVYRWTLQFAKTTDRIGDVTIEEMVLEAFIAFWRAFTPDKLQQADRLASLLAYLKLCAATSVLQARRKARQRAVEITWDEVENKRKTAAMEGWSGTEAAVLHHISAAQLWMRVEHCCQHEKDRILVRLSLMANLKPRVILAQHPELFTDVTEIYALSRNLKNRLGRDEALRQLCREWPT